MTFRLPLRPEFADTHPYGAPQLDVPVCLNVNENPYPPSEVLVDAIADAVAAASKRLNRYPDRDFSALREDLASYLEEETGVPIAPHHVWAANGSNEVMLHLLMAFAGPGRSVLSFTPTYSMYGEYARDTHSRWVVGKRKPDFSLDMEDVARALGQERPAVVLLASPNNPTGTALAREDIETVLKIAKESGPEEGTASIVVIDEAYAEFRREGTPSALELLEKNPHLVVTRTMSKAFGAAGLRLGYMAACKEIIDQLTVVRLPYHLSALTQAAARAALAHRDELRVQVQQIRRSRDALAVSLRELGLDTVVSDANFLLFGKFPERHKVWRNLLDRGVLIRETGPEGYLRVSVGTPEENKVFLKALKESMR